MGFLQFMALAWRRANVRRWLAVRPGARLVLSGSLTSLLTVPLTACEGNQKAGGAGPWWVWLVVLALVALAAAAGLWIGAQRADARAQAERRARERRWLALRRLHEGLYWQTDAQLRITVVEDESRPSAGATPARAGASIDTRHWPGALLTDLVADAGAPGSTPLHELLAGQGLCAARAVSLAGAPATAQTAALEISATPLVDDLGRFIGYLGVLRAPTPVQHADEHKDRDDAQSFSYTVSHDLRAPVRVVEGFTRILKEDYGAQIDRVGNDHLDRVLGAAARMNQMIDALLAIARLSTQPLLRQPVNLSQLAAFIVEDLRRGAPERQIQIDIEPGMLTQGDPTLLRQVLENLLGNAWKYTQRQHEPQLRFGRETAGEQVAYVVRDNGAGFDMRSVDRLFGLFQRLHSASEFPGTGVGLASVKRIVMRHGGRIWAEAEPGRGAAFYFTLRG
jgi:signal transduction histidine kinase